MDQTQLDGFRAQLLAEQAELEALQSSSKDSADTVTLDQSKVGRLSRMDALQSQQMAQETARRRQQQLQKIAAALRRVDKGEYGYCVSCEEEINAARLDIDPASLKCMRCMES